MNRRHFIQTLFAAPLLTQSILGSTKTHSSSELHLISEQPHRILPELLEELKKYGHHTGNTFAFSNSSPYEKQMIQSLQKKSWTFSPVQTNSSLLLTFRSLRHKTQPSFTLARKENVWDIRSQKLYSLWKEINQKHAVSSTLTIASFRGIHQKLTGKAVSVFHQGQKIDSLALDQNITKSYQGTAGNIILTVNNGNAWIKESTCRHQICRLTPPVSLAGERIICAPNRFLAEVDRTRHVDTSIG
ncbi:MAG: hypothetical protein GF421_02725 [Candidatus Aminicenantes bacterium]|nr:hypothetical protein [Candidatus Aminicenantes bacterium]